MRYLKFTKPGDTLGFIAPAFGCTIEPYKSAFANALRKFQGMGYKTWIGPNVYEDAGIGISNTPELCGKELTEAYCSAECDAILSCGGGEMMCETIGKVDWEKIKQAEPKLYMGYSDNTNTTFLLETLCDTASIYGSCAPTFGMEPWHPALTMQWQVYTGERKDVHGFPLYEKESLKSDENPLAPWNCTEESLPVTALDSKGNDSVRGRLIGGCLDCLVNLCGTRFDRVKEFLEKYKEDGFLWYLEACDLNVMSIRRALWELREAGWFRYAKGFLIGRPLNGEEAFGLDRIDAVMGILAELDVPVFLDLDFGHMPPMMPIVNGAIATASVTEGVFHMEYEYC